MLGDEFVFLVKGIIVVLCFVVKFVKSFDGYVLIFVVNGVFLNGINFSMDDKVYRFFIVGG